MLFQRSPEDWPTPIESDLVDCWHRTPLTGTKLRRWEKKRKKKVWAPETENGPVKAGDQRPVSTSSPDCLITEREKMAESLLVRCAEATERAADRMSKQERPESAIATLNHNCHAPYEHQRTHTHTQSLPECNYLTFTLTVINSRILHGEKDPFIPRPQVQRSFRRKKKSAFTQTQTHITDLNISEITLS